MVDALHRLRRQGVSAHGLQMAKDGLGGHAQRRAQLSLGVEVRQPFTQLTRQLLLGQHFAVHQHAVTIEDHLLQGCTHLIILSGFPIRGCPIHARASCAALALDRELS
ncbi:hypothetical protein [Cobetia sp.]|uniref:hypothetical protein n=1 Tax=Cobetia sp. TaxID=1873876 RepID=UPI00257A1232|nr:hypothetical protein [Cobetia sp.]